MIHVLKLELLFFGYCFRMILKLKEIKSMFLLEMMSNVNFLKVTVSLVKLVSAGGH